MYTPQEEPLTREQVLALVKSATQSEYYRRDLALLFLFLGTGMRISEVAALTLQDVQQKPTGWFIKHRSLKNNMPTWVPLSPLVFKVLFSYLVQNYSVLPSFDALSADRLFQLPEKPRMPIFQNQNGEALSSTAIGYILSRLAVETGIISPAGRRIAHRLRRTCIDANWFHSPDEIFGLAAFLKLHELGFIDDWYPN